jgi:hypothetical protein
MTRYTPTEILQAGIDQTRETFADLYVDLDRARKAIDFHWHRVNVDPTVALVDGEERLAEHGAGVDFGGNEIALRTRTVDLTRLTDAGLALFTIGVRTALTERDQLQATLAATLDELAAARTAPTQEARQTNMRSYLHMIDVTAARKVPLASTPVTASAWAVRVPGTTTILPAVDDADGHRLPIAA